MTRTRKGAGRSSKSQEVKSAEQEVKRLKEQARKILLSAGKDIRQVRSEVAKLKKAGIVSSRLDVRRYSPSRYMISKLKKNADILSGESIAVRAPKEVRRKYVEKGLYEQRGGSLIVPRDYANQRTKISRGLVEVSRSLAMGEEQRLILPYKATDMEALAYKMRDDPTLEGMKKPDELFGFRLFGHNMATIGFPNADEMADYILTRYHHLFSGKNGRAGVKQFVLYKFKARDSQLTESAEAGRIYSPRRKRAESQWSQDKRRTRDALRKQKERAKETPQENKSRLDKQRIRSAQNRQRKFDES